MPPTKYSSPYTPPGTPLHRGEKKLDTMRLHHYFYDATEFEEVEMSDASAFQKRDHKVNFLVVRGLHHEGLIEEIGRSIGLHALSTEDILDTETRNKLEEYPDYLLFVMRIPYVDDKENVVSEQVSFVLKDDLLVAFCESERPDFSELVNRLSRGATLRTQDVDDLLAAALDLIVDQFFDIFDIIAKNIDNFEESIARDPRPDQLEGVHGLKRDLIHLRGVLWPLRESAAKLAKSYVHKVNGDTVYYMRDVEDHVIQLLQMVETYQQIATSLVDSYLSAIGNRTNEVMKVLTIFSTIFIPLTFLAGVYGMNFKYMPELYHEFAYPTFWIVCLITLLVLIRYFKKKNWI